MADPIFFNKSKSYSVAEIVDLVACDISCDTGHDLILDDVCALKSAKPNQLSFLDNIKYKNDFLETEAGACFVSPALAKFAPDNVICLISDSPYKAYALAAQLFYPDVFPKGDISDKSNIGKSSIIGKGSYIGNNVEIGENVVIGENVWIEANTVIGSGVKIGNNCHIDSNVTISHSIIDEHVRIYAGAKIGQDGFGFAMDLAGHVKVPQLGRVIIGSHVEIGANTTIDRGAGPDTVIGQGTWIDNLVQIGHNVEIGRGCVIVAQVGISGSTKIEDYVAIGGQVGIAGHLNIGMGARIGAQAGVIGDLDGGQEYLGSPAMPKRQFFKQVAALNRLIKKKKRD